MFLGGEVSLVCATEFFLLIVDFFLEQVYSALPGETPGVSSFDQPVLIWSIPEPKTILRVELLLVVLERGTSWSTVFGVLLSDTSQGFSSRQNRWLLGCVLVDVAAIGQMFLVGTWTTVTRIEKIVCELCGGLGVVIYTWTTTSIDWKYSCTVNGWSNTTLSSCSCECLWQYRTPTSTGISDSLHVPISLMNAQTTSRLRYVYLITVRPVVLFPRIASGLHSWKKEWGVEVLTKSAGNENWPSASHLWYNGEGWMCSPILVLRASTSHISISCVRPSNWVT